MKVKIKTKKEVDVKTLNVDAGVRYWEDGTVDGIEDTEGELIPCKEGDRWKPIIDLEKGQITNWTKGKVADIHYKVCDDGLYYLKDAAGNTVLEKDGYVPKMMCPKENGYGDYIIMDVDKDGFIDGFKFDTDGFADDDD